MKLVDPKKLIFVEPGLADVEKQEKEKEKLDTKYDWYKRWYSFGEKIGKASPKKEDIICFLSFKLHAVNEEQNTIEKEFVKWLDNNLLTGKAKEDAEAIKHANLKWGFK